MPSAGIEVGQNDAKEGSTTQTTEIMGEVLTCLFSVIYKLTNKKNNRGLIKAISLKSALQPRGREFDPPGTAIEFKGLNLGRGFPEKVQVGTTRHPTIEFGPPSRSLSAFPLILPVCKCRELSWRQHALATLFFTTGAVPRAWSTVEYVRRNVCHPTWPMPSPCYIAALAFPSPG